MGAGAAREEQRMAREVSRAGHTPPTKRPGRLGVALLVAVLLAPLGGPGAGVAANSALAQVDGPAPALGGAPRFDAPLAASTRGGAGAGGCDAAASCTARTETD